MLSIPSRFEAAGDTESTQGSRGHGVNPEAYGDTESTQRQMGIRSQPKGEEWGHRVDPQADGNTESTQWRMGRRSQPKEVVLVDDTQGFHVDST
ncbi:hypothetical protein BDD12DRAFT_903457 [Trichophaea hybrida]|nr:hypothetical protein BDD12DRAFT_903457 [Trichophaea hybrida]